MGFVDCHLMSYFSYDFLLWGSDVEVPEISKNRRIAETGAEHEL